MLGEEAGEGPCMSLSQLFDPVFDHLHPSRRERRRLAWGRTCCSTVPLAPR